MADTFYVQIIAYKSEEKVKQMGPFSERRAENIDKGININLNHEEYYTLVVNSEEEKV